uniref:Putative secreted protein n=1 Tax=Anopheles darlingi TaxID=43151 RepID=A0A2M4D9X4_ANODA
MLIHWCVALYVIIDCYVRSSSSTTGRLRFPLPRSLRSSARRLSCRWLVCRRAHLVQAIVEAQHRRGRAVTTNQNNQKK